MNAVKLYKITITKGINMADEGKTYFSLEPWGNSTTEIQGYDDGGQLYVLPNGYHVAESADGTLMLYGDRDNHYREIGRIGPTPTVDGQMLKVFRGIE